MKSIAVLLLAAILSFSFSCAKKIKVGPEEARVIAKEAYIYGYPIVENYKLAYSYAVYKNSGAYKAPFNHLAMVMPDTTGWEVAHQLKLDQRTAKTPLFLVTAFPSRASEQWAFDGDCDALLVKPVEPSRLLAEVARWVV